MGPRPEALPGPYWESELSGIESSGGKKRGGMVTTPSGGGGHFLQKPDPFSRRAEDSKTNAPKNGATAKAVKKDGKRGGRLPRLLQTPNGWQLGNFKRKVPKKPIDQEKKQPLTYKVRSTDNRTNLTGDLSMQAAEKDVHEVKKKSKTKQAVHMVCATNVREFGKVVNEQVGNPSSSVRPNHGAESETGRVKFRKKGGPGAERRSFSPCPLKDRALTQRTEEEGTELKNKLLFLGSPRGLGCVRRNRRGFAKRGKGSA